MADNRVRYLEYFYKNLLFIIYFVGNYKKYIKKKQSIPQEYII